MINRTQKSTLQKRLNTYLQAFYETNIESATSVQLYFAIGMVSNEFLRENQAKTTENNLNRPIKTLHYLSIEFLIGKSLKNNLWNLGIESNMRKVLKSFGKNLDDVFEIENDAGLGNGGLGRLAACYLESLAKCGYSAVGHSIKYEFGLFKQKIVDGKQIEVPDEWLKTGHVWLHERNDLVEEVEIGGHVIEHYNEKDGLSFELADTLKIEAVPFDMLISASGTENTTTLRLWEARAKDAIDLHLFDLGEYESSLKTHTKVSEINKILYPNDDSEAGKDLRLIQQYFLVSSSMQSILRSYFAKNKTLENLSKTVAVHINDTHPALCVPEIMRLLIDKYGFSWEASWNAITKTIFYTNHTILTESLEVKKLSTIQKFIPRIAQILKEIDRRFRIELADFFKNDYFMVEKLAVISGNSVYMANLAICASKFVNGVAKIHSEILKSRIFYDYYKLFPKKFTNVTNGISHRRWLCQSNPKLDSLIISLIGNGFYDEPEKLKGLSSFQNEEILNELSKIKFANKKRLADYVKDNYQIEIDPNARFDIQVKRIHEYKRQLLNALKIIYLVHEIRENPNENWTKQVFIFAGKAASGYFMARRIIELINCLAKEIDEDEVVSKFLKVVFLENYSVTLAEMLMPATEVSEQISLAGREASGTGNMKAVINGSLMLCTVDGANVEICEKCGSDNMFEFGLRADEVHKINQVGYNPIEYYEKSDKIRLVLETLKNGFGGEKFEDIERYLLGFSSRRDNYMCLADFESYLSAHYKMDKAYRNKLSWNKKVLQSISNMGFFSSDRSINEYAKKIWKLDSKEITE